MGQDNTDAVERLYIQYGTSFCYPISSIGAHVSAVPNHQMFRTTPSSVSLRIFPRTSRHSMWARVSRKAKFFCAGGNSVQLLARMRQLIMPDRS